MFGFPQHYSLLSHIPKKNKSIPLISPMHSDDAVCEDSQQPEIIDFYNAAKGGVDVVDRLRSEYNSARNTRR